MAGVDHLDGIHAIGIRPRADEAEQARFGDGVNGVGIAGGRTASHKDAQRLPQAGVNLLNVRRRDARARSTRDDIQAAETFTIGRSLNVTVIGSVVVSRRHIGLIRNPVDRHHPAIRKPVDAPESETGVDGIAKRDQRISRVDAGTAGTWDTVGAISARGRAQCGISQGGRTA